MSKLGIDNSTQVICYDRSAGLYSFRLIWALYYHGHKNVNFWMEDTLNGFTKIMITKNEA